MEHTIRGRIDRRSGQHDCIIGVSGGKDSTRQALWVRDNLGFNPLLVSTAYPPRQATDRGVDNVANLINLDFDILISSPNPDTWRQMMRASFFEYANWAKSTELALFSSVPRIAIDLGIPLILWGENPALQLGDLGTMGRDGMDGNHLRYMNTLGGGSNEWLKRLGFSEPELIPYTYPSEEEFVANDVTILFLGWALGDWSLLNNGIYAGLVGLRSREEKPEFSGDPFGVSSLDEDWVAVNQMIKYYKFGFGRATEYVNELIRSGDLGREEAVSFVESYDGVCDDSYVESFCDFIGISIQEFWTSVRRSMNRELFTWEDGARPEPLFRVAEGLP